MKQITFDCRDDRLVAYDNRPRRSTYSSGNENFRSLQMRTQNTVSLRLNFYVLIVILLNEYFMK
jgi:hypothetical protein